MKKLLLVTAISIQTLTANAGVTSLSSAVTLPVIEPTGMGARFSLDGEIGPFLNLGTGFSQAEPHLEESISSAFVRMTIPIQTSTNSRLYPVVGVDQAFNQSSLQPDLFFGAGFEYQWFNQWGTFVETRYQTERESNLHLEFGIRFWPGGAKPAPPPRVEPDVVELPSPVINTNETEVTDSESDENPIEQKETVAKVTTVVKRASEERSAPPKNVAREEEAVVPDNPVNVTRIIYAPVIYVNTINDIPSGDYVHLAFFREFESIQNFKLQIARYPWSEGVEVNYDPELQGYRVMLGPFSRNRAMEMRYSIMNDGQESFIYHINR